jgi:hypothetical protein
VALKYKALGSYKHTSEEIQKIKETMNRPEIKEKKLQKYREWRDSLTEEQKSEYRKKLSEAHLASPYKKKKGMYVCSEEQKQQISAANKGRVQSPEERRKRSESRKAYFAKKRGELTIQDS